MPQALLIEQALRLTLWYAQDERRKASMRKRTNTKSGEEKWFLAPGTHMNAFQVRMPLCVRRVQQL